MLKRGVPITLVLDNARHQKSQIVIALASKKKSNYLSLRLITELETRRQTLETRQEKLRSSEYYANFAKGRDPITDCLIRRTPRTRSRRIFFLHLIPYIQGIMTFDYMKYSDASFEPLEMIKHHHSIQTSMIYRIT